MCPTPTTLTLPRINSGWSWARKKLEEQKHINTLKLDALEAGDDGREFGAEEATSHLQNYLGTISDCAIPQQGRKCPEGRLIGRARELRI